MDEVERLLALLATGDRFADVDPDSIDRTAVKAALQVFHVQTGLTVPDGVHERRRYLRRLNAICWLDRAVEKDDWNEVALRLPLLAAECATHPIIGPTGSSG